MCDTMVVMPDASKEGVTLFAKNSDRPEFDSQALVLNERLRHDPSSTLAPQYVELPQARETYRTLGFRPYWCWGYETGMNEHRVAIGNEALYTRPLYQEENRRERGLIGMNLLRLALERGKTAYEAMRVIVDLAERYGQWGSAVPGRSDEDGSYGNSFLIADPGEAWVLELAGRRWAAMRITRGAYAISNEPTITTEWDESSDDLVDYAVEQGWWPPSRRDAFNFAWAYGAHEQRAREGSHIRVMRARQLLRERESGIDVPWLMRILRDHLEDTFLQGPMFSPDNPDFHTICMHASPTEFTWGNTASSVVATLPAEPERPSTFWASLVTPCTGLFTPFSIDADVPPALANVGTAEGAVREPESAPLDEYDAASPWWQYKDLLDRIGRDCNARAPVARAAFDKLEARRLEEADRICHQAHTLRSDGRHEEASRLLTDFVAERWEETLRALAEVREAVGG